MPSVGGFIGLGLLLIAVDLDKRLTEYFGSGGDDSHLAAKYPGYQQGSMPGYGGGGAPPALRAAVWSLPVDGLIAWHFVSQRIAQNKPAALAETEEDTARDARRAKKAARKAAKAKQEKAAARKSKKASAPKAAPRVYDEEDEAGDHVHWHLAKVAAWAMTGAALGAALRMAMRRRADRQADVGTPPAPAVVKVVPVAAAEEAKSGALTWV